MQTRRDFIRQAAILSGAAGATAMIPASVLRAMTINPAAGSTFMDAEHIVVLMQENRSFDHCFGALQGVRGFNDPRAIRLPNQNLVWMQENAKGHTYAPFRLNIKETRSTWLGSLPHSWTNQVDARNNGHYDKWLDSKASGRKGFEQVPLTMGYYNREDLPFYYAMADAFTVCDQNFCSSLTGTTPNRLFLWTGTVRPEQSAKAPAFLRNENLDYDREAHWKTFPEVLEDHAVSWKIYQNELSLPTGLNGDEDAWLANFTDNPIEWFSQFNVRYAAAYRENLKKLDLVLPTEIAALESSLTTMDAGKKKDSVLKAIGEKQQQLIQVRKDIQFWTAEKYAKLSQKEKNMHDKAFTTNKNDPDYRSLTKLTYKDGAEDRKMLVPKGDPLYQFRTDVAQGKLPAVSWLVASENFSDHPGAPWYGSWYVSEALDILTKNPEVWKKTIFILCYDENDGYFDHVPPFVAPDPADSSTGKVSAGIDTGVEFCSLAEDQKWNPGSSHRGGPVGLGYRVPLVIASPWSRGGNVCSEVFDHTSVLQLMEKLLSHRTGKKIEAANISSWRRTICGDLSSVFQPYHGESVKFPVRPVKERFMEQIYNSQFKPDPLGYIQLSAAQIAEANAHPSISSVLPKQEPGIRKSTALPYEIYADGFVNRDTGKFDLTLTAGNKLFGKTSSGVPFTIYRSGLAPASYAVSAGEWLKDAYQIADRAYAFEVHGPNGFYRKFSGLGSDPDVQIRCKYELSGQLNQLTGHVLLELMGSVDQPLKVLIRDNAYHAEPMQLELLAREPKNIVWNTGKSYGWYDFSVFISGYDAFEYRFAGRVETGKSSHTDPFMGR
ncbi:phosphocholine-specific phospholipase C [Pedobacter duraquae]|uniref:phospholipase C n=1 Tax=Pedobacter duraquae TaxID=425511 RepID=A0A4R6II85_9SPHI|nr:phospholipase C, phosphocholine-specific [Pedobacter duraquae]TDO21657.1 phospholipase C [Pedobacter duraquae]